MVDLFIAGVNAEDPRPFLLSDDLLAFSKFVKNGEGRACKHGEHTVLPFISFSFRSLTIYVSDAVQAAMKTVAIEEGRLEEEKEQKEYLEYADAVLDVQTCSGDEGRMASLATAVGPLQTLGLGLILKIAAKCRKSKLNIYCDSPVRRSQKYDWTRLD